MGTGERPGTVVLTDTQTHPISSAWSGPAAILNLFLAAVQDQGVSSESKADWEGSEPQMNHTALLLLCLPSRYGPPWESKQPFSCFFPPTGASQLSLCFSFLLPFLSLLFSSVFGFLPCRCGNDRQRQDSFIF